MTIEEKKKLMDGLLKGANLEHAQINIVLEEGTTISYGNAPTTENNKSTNASQQVNQMILDYVDRLKPMVRNEYQSCYDQLWTGILELKEVKMQVYDSGKQRDTKFNRNLVAQIIHQMADKVFVQTANTVNMAQCLEPTKGSDHPVRQKLGEAPEKQIKKSVDDYLKQYIFG